MLVYGQSGLKSYYGGHDNRAHDNLYAFTDGHCVNIGFGHETFVEGHEDAFVNNTCVMRSAGPYMKIGCSGGTLPQMGNNSVHDVA